MPLYQIPTQYYFRLHHPRPRFKSDIEQVLIFIASEITAIGRKKKADFIKDFNAAIRRYPGNLSKKQKTIDNWRTEIDALFCFIKDQGNELEPSNRAIELSTHQDLVKFFKLFCYHFQYPGGFIKPEKNLEMLKQNIDFRPASYILQMLDEVEKKDGVRAGITKAEATHCIFNDLQVTRDKRAANDTWQLIKINRKRNFEYDWDGDITRYAGDVLDYMVQANLLRKRPDGKYYINHLEDLAIQRFLNPTDEFNYYKKLPHIQNVTLDDVKRLEVEWVDYFNTTKDEGFFNTDILALLTDTTEEYEKLKTVIIDIDKLIDDADLSTTSGIGTLGESLILNHEKKRITSEGRQDLEHLIKFIPTALAIGYDINSREFDARHRFIEVKTTASSTPVDFRRFHLTTNEWAAAETSGERYFVYRLMVTKGNVKLLQIQDPVGEYKKGNLSAVPRDGMDIIFDPSRCGVEVELLM